MLSTRILTAAILACILLAGLFLLSPLWAVLAFGAAFTIGAWEWGGFGALRGGVARAAYTAGVALLLLLTWR
jgi:CDP-diglyceride synthetase